MLMNLRVECLHKLFEIILHGQFLFLVDLFVCFFFKDVFYLFERESRDKAWARGEEGEGEAGSLLNREPALGPGSWSEPKAEA